MGFDKSSVILDRLELDALVPKLAVNQVLLEEASVPPVVFERLSEMVSALIVSPPASRSVNNGPAALRSK